MPRTHSGASDTNSQIAGPPTTIRASRSVCQHLTIQTSLKLFCSKKRAKSKTADTAQSSQPCQRCHQPCSAATGMHAGCLSKTIKTKFGNTVERQLQRQADGKFHCPSCAMSFVNATHIKVSPTRTCHSPLTGATATHFPAPGRPTDCAPFRVIPTGDLCR